MDYQTEYREKQHRLKRLQEWFSDLENPTEGDCRYFGVMQERILWDLSALYKRITQ